MFAYRRLAFLGMFIASIVCQLSLTGCTLLDHRSSTYELEKPDPSKGVVVGTLFMRTEFLGRDNASLSLWGPGKYEVVSLSLRSFTQSPYDFSEHGGVGRAFALQLAPGKYKLGWWSIFDGNRNGKLKSSEGPEPIVEFEVQAGKTVYLGRFDANQRLEVASIHDNLSNDILWIKKIPAVNVKEIENRSLNVRGWWLKDAVGKEILRRMGNPRCDQC